VVFVTPMPIGLPLLFIGSVPSYETAAVRGPVQAPITVFVAIPTMIIVMLSIPVTMVSQVIMFVCGGGDGQQKSNSERQDNAGVF